MGRTQRRGALKWDDFWGIKVRVKAPVRDVLSQLGPFAARLWLVELNIKFDIPPLRKSRPGSPGLPS